MSDRAIVICAIAGWVGAMRATPIALPIVALAVVGLIFIVRQRLPPTAIAAAVAVVVALVASALASRAWVEVQTVEPGRWSGIASLANDPQPERGGVRVDLVVDGQRVQARAWGSPAGQLRARLLGERIEVTGTVRRIESASPWFASRGVSGTMTIDRTGPWSTGKPHYRLANALRRTIETGAASLDRSQRSLLTGFVYGDDRFQGALTADAFRAAGLTHLLAVSGQNVAFVLIICGPLLRRVGFRGRFLITLVALLVFATLTRFEPSVMRASLMAAVASLATVLGRSASSTRILALAVTVLVLVDPLIVHALAFQLSVAASVGILIIAPALVPLIPGPRVFREAVAVTSGAQLAVAPLLVTIFGGVPVASLPANIVAGPAAGPIMMWGLTAGAVAGVVVGPVPAVAWLIHLPTRLLIGWVQHISEIAAVMPLGQLRLMHLIALGIAISVRYGARDPTTRRLSAAAILIVLFIPALQLQFAPPRSFVVDDQTTVWRDDRFTIMHLDPASDVEDLLEAFRDHGVRRLDLVVTPGTRASFSQLVVIEERLAIGTIWAPKDHRVPGAETPVAGTSVRLGRTTLVVIDDAAGFRLQNAVVGTDGS